MGFFDTLFSRGKKKDDSANKSNDSIKTSVARNITTPQSSLYKGAFDFLPRRYGHISSLDTKNIRNRLSTNRILEVLSDIDPDVSMGVWTMLRVSDTPLTYQAKDRDGKDDPEGQAILEDIIRNLNAPVITNGYTHSSGLEKIKTQLHLTSFVHGAACVEALPTEELDDLEKIIVVDPISIEFTRENRRLIPWQRSGYGEKKKLDYPNFIYEDLDSFPGDPYGRSPILSTLQIVFFKIQVLEDLRMVVHKQGYPRIDIEILEEVLIKNAHASVKSSEEKLRKFVEKRIKEIMDGLTSLDPDMPFVHVDSIKTDILGGNQGPVIDVQKLMDVIDSQIVAATKTLSVFLGRHFGKTETYANIEVQIYNKTVDAIRELAARALARALSIGLRLRGNQGTVEITYEKLDWRSPQEREQAIATKIGNALKMRDEGWITDEQACESVTGHKPKGTPKEATDEQGGDSLA